MSGTAGGDAAGNDTAGAAADRAREGLARAESGDAASVEAIEQAREADPAATEAAEQVAADGPEGRGLSR